MVSAYASDEMMREIDRIAREEGREPAQVGSTALQLYAMLPLAARKALLEVSAAEARVHTGVLERAITEVSRALLSAKWEITDARVVREIRERGTLPEGDLSEDDVGRLAVEHPAAPAVGGN